LCQIFKKFEKNIRCRQKFYFVGINIGWFCNISGHTARGAELSFAGANPTIFKFTATTPAL
jgi:hypothetical protein